MATAVAAAEGDTVVDGEKGHRAAAAVCVAEQQNKESTVVGGNTLVGGLGAEGSRGKALHDQGERGRSH